MKLKHILMINYKKQSQKELKALFGRTSQTLKAVFKVHMQRLGVFIDRTLKPQHLHFPMPFIHVLKRRENPCFSLTVMIVVDFI